MEQLLRDDLLNHKEEDAYHFHANEETDHVFKQQLNFTQFSRCSYFEIIGIEHA